MPLFFPVTCQACSPFCPLPPFTCLLLSLVKVEQTRTSTLLPIQLVGGWLPHERSQRMVARPKVTKGTRGSGLACDWGAQMANRTLFPTRLVMPCLLCCAKSRTRDGWTPTNVIRCCWGLFNKLFIDPGRLVTYDKKQGEPWESGLPILWSSLFYPSSIYSSIQTNLCIWEIWDWPEQSLCVCLLGDWVGLSPAPRSAIAVQQ